MSDFIRVEKYNHIVVATLDRPQVRNALSSSVIEELRQLTQMLTHDIDTRVVIFTGAKDVAFSAGADLKERVNMSEIETLNFVTKIQNVFQSIANLPMPTIAAINGNAFGGGLELALACDMRVMAKTAQIGLTECSLGIVPGAGGTQRLPRLVGMARAMELIFAARRINAADALAYGLVNMLANDADDARTRARELAHTIAENAPLAIRAAKEAILATQEKSLREGLVVELASYHEILDSADRKEGLKAFLEKRPPHFHGA